MAYHGFSYSLCDIGTRLAEAFERSLPGRRAQDLMAPSWRKDPEMLPAAENPDRPCLEIRYRDAAVLILLHPSRDGDRLQFPLVLRPRTMRHHSGQIALPGGGLEPGESARDAALREMREELGLDLDPACVVGELTALEIPHSAYLVHPFVALYPGNPEYVLQVSEVDSVIEGEMETLMQPGTRFVVERKRDGTAREAPCFDFSGKIVWGATAMILSELGTLFGSFSGA